MTDTIERTDETAEALPPAPTKRRISRATLALHQVAANDESRPVLGRVQVQGGKAYAADGFMAAWATLPDDETEGEPEPLGIPRDTAKKALTRTTAREPGAVVEVLEEGRILITGDAKPDEPIAGQAETEGDYPDVEKLVDPTKQPRAFTRLDVDRLKQLAAFLDTALGAAEKHEARMVELRLHGPLQATEWRAISASGEHVTALLMPMTPTNTGEGGWVFDPVEEAEEVSDGK